MPINKLTESPNFDVMKRPPAKPSLQERINLARTDELYPPDRRNVTIAGSETLKENPRRGF